MRTVLKLTWMNILKQSRLYYNQPWHMPYKSFMSIVVVTHILGTMVFYNNPCHLVRFVVRPLLALPSPAPTPSSSFPTIISNILQQFFGFWAFEHIIFNKLSKVNCCFL